MPEDNATQNQQTDGQGTGGEGQQGQQTPPTSPTDTQVKMVPEKDLLALKGSLEKQINELKTELGNSKKTADDNYQTLLQERASKEAAEKQLQTLTEQAQRVSELEAQLAATKTSGEESVNKLLELRREILTQKYNISPDMVKDKSQQELDYFEQALQAVGEHRTSGIDGGGGGGVGREGMTSREKMLAGLTERHRE